jgi:3-(3-hydroxy-phenyl)propionate hydroxylase
MAVESTSDDAEVVIIGAGPVGLAVANYLGLYGVRTLVIEALSALIDYPRGVGMDDECLRTFQGLGLVDGVLPHTTPNHWLRFVTARGRVFASIEPRTTEFGWPRRNAFVQPLADKVLLEGLNRFEHVTVLWEHEATEISQDANGVRVVVRTPDNNTRIISASYLVGSDGGRSLVRKSLGVSWEGKSDPTRWLVVDARNDPIGTPNAFVICDWRRPYVSIALPHGIRRFEFMLLPKEDEEEMTKPERVTEVLRERVPELADVEKIDFIRHRVYTHHARLAGSFVSGRICIAGDAAHLMPVWQGQGYNSGIRDAANLGWKLSLMVRGLAEQRLLASYDLERRDHAAAMIQISQAAGALVRFRNPVSAGLRDLATKAMEFVPSVRRYVLEMRYKPMPRYHQGVVTPVPKGVASPVGRLFIQPRVLTVDGTSVLLDDVLGPRFAVIMWGQDPRAHLDDASARLWSTVDAQFVAARPATQVGANQAPTAPGTIVVSDATGALKTWFETNNVSIVVVRPDRFVAAATTPAGISRDTGHLFRALYAT